MIDGSESFHSPPVGVAYEMMHARVLNSESGLGLEGDTQDGLQGNAYESTVTHTPHALSSVELCEIFEAFKCSGPHVVNALTPALDGVARIERLVEFPGSRELGLDGWACVAFEHSHGPFSESRIGFDE